MHTSNSTTRLTILICIFLLSAAITTEAFGQGSLNSSKIDQRVTDALASQSKVFVLVHFGASPSPADITSVADIARPNSASEVYEMHALGMVAAEIDNATINQIAAQRSVTQITIDPIGTVLMPEAGPFIRADLLNDSPISLTGAGVTVAIIDTGIDASHPSFANANFRPANVAPTERCFCRITPGCCASDTDTTDSNGHGTRMVGTLIDNDGVNPGGIAPDVEIVPFKVFNNSGLGLLGEWAMVVDLLLLDPTAYGIDIVSNSLGFGQGTSGNGPLFQTECSVFPNWASIGTKINVMASNPTMFIGGTGNRGSVTREGGPACLANVLSVAGHLDVPGTAIAPLAPPCNPPYQQGTAEIACDSDHNMNTDLVAPGSFITSSMAGGGTLTSEGTSYSVAITAGCVALMMEAVPGASIAEITEAITTGTTKKIPSHNPSANSKLYPQLDCFSAVNWLMWDRADVEAIVEHDPMAEEVRLAIKVNGERSSTDLILNWNKGSASTYSGGAMIGNLNSSCSVSPFTIGSFYGGTCSFNEVDLGQEIEIARFDLSQLVTDPYNDVIYSLDVITSSRTDHVPGNNSASESFSGAVSQ